MSLRVCRIRTVTQPIRCLHCRNNSTEYWFNMGSDAWKIPSALLSLHELLRLPELLLLNVIFCFNNISHEGTWGARGGGGFISIVIF